ncbi:uncharacterized protein LOC132402960 isoform X2 [Hypanus sabinus]|uniref:uncharacterized protein LOC132402960 isoform X2 n=2 Tax=Hypanus sabinus TaxID=79690 RepID=UPI0028C3CC1D|nr:uncharacterized protein LOC132402960 isoform X2 [Hypanus sabinus]
MGSLACSSFSLFVFCVVVSKSVADPGPKWQNENTATESRMSPVEGFLNNWTAKPRHDGEIAHELSDPLKVYAGDNLFQVSIEVKFVGANFKEFEGMDRRISRSLKRLLMEKLSTFSTFKELFPLTVKSPGQENVYIPLENRVKQLLSESVSNLRYGKAAVVLTSVEDVDECVSGLSMCDPEANCLNTFGFYFCQCAKGFNDPSSIASGISCVRNVKSEIERLSQFISALKNCYMTIEGDSDKCLSPVYPCIFEYKWCNWTVVASHWKGVVVQIHVVLSPEDCNQNKDEILICISQQIVQVAQTCLNKTENFATSVLAVYATFEQGSSNQAGKCFQVEHHMLNEIKTSSPSLYAVLMLSNFGLSQEINAAPDSEDDEKSHVIQPSNLLSSEAAELVFWNCEGRWSDAHFQVFAQLMAKKHGVWKSTEQSDYFLVSSHGVQLSAQQHASNLEHVHLWNSLCAQLLSRTSKRLPSAHSEFSSLLSPSLVGFPGSTPSEEMQYRGNSVQLDVSGGISMGLVKSFDPADRWTALESNLVSDDWVSPSWDVFENPESGHSVYKKTLPVQTLQTYKCMQTKTDHQEPREPQSSVEIINAGMREFETVYSISLGRMVLSSLTTSFHDQAWMKTKSQSLFAVEGGLQTLYQTDETVPLIAPSHVYTSLETNSSVVTENEPRNSEVKWLKTQMFSSRTFIEPVQQDTEATEKEIDRTSLLGASQTINPSISQPPVWMTLVPKLQDEDVENTGHLLEVSARVDLANLVYKNLRHLEKRLLQSVQNLIMNNLMSFYPPLQKILPKGTKRISPSGFHFVYELHFGPDGENVKHNLQMHLNSLSNKLVANMHNGQVYLVSITVKDSGFRSSFGIKEILTASAVGAFLLVSLALALCFVIFKRSHKKNFKPQNPYAASISGRNSTSEELESEELIVRRGSVNYIIQKISTNI